MVRPPPFWARAGSLLGTTGVSLSLVSSPIGSPLPAFSSQAPLTKGDEVLTSYYSVSTCALALPAFYFLRFIHMATTHETMITTVTATDSIAPVPCHLSNKLTVPFIMLLFARSCKSSSCAPVSSGSCCYSHPPRLQQPGPSLKARAFRSQATVASRQHPSGCLLSNIA